VVKAYKEAEELPISHFGVVTSGCALSSKGIERIGRAMRRGKMLELLVRLPGCLDKSQLSALKEAGLKRFFIKSRDVESFFHRFVRLIVMRSGLPPSGSTRAGLEVCCGGILVWENPWNSALNCRNSGPRGC